MMLDIVSWLRAAPYFARSNYDIPPAIRRMHARISKRKKSRDYTLLYRDSSHDDVQLDEEVEGHEVVEGEVREESEDSLRADKNDLRDYEQVQPLGHSFLHALRPLNLIEARRVDVDQSCCSARSIINPLLLLLLSATPYGPEMCLCKQVAC